MTTCSECGATTANATQCAQCGAFLDGAAELDLEVEPAPRVREHQGATIELPSATLPPSPSPLSAAPGAAPTTASHPAAASATEHRGERQADAVPERAASANPATFGARMRRDRLDFWRYTRLPIIAILGWFTLSCVAFGASWVFVDNVNLLLHEGGHLVFSAFGTTIHALGGTLMQLMFPAAFAGYFWFARKDRFATLAALWWLSENFFGIARYMADAPFETLPLVGGDTHDWNFLFSRWGLISSAQEIGRGARILGVVGTTVCLVLMLRIAWRPTEAEITSTDQASE